MKVHANEYQNLTGVGGGVVEQEAVVVIGVSQKVKVCPNQSETNCRLAGYC